MITLRIEMVKCAGIVTLTGPAAENRMGVSAEVVGAFIQEAIVEARKWMLHDDSPARIERVIEKEVLGHGE